MNVSSWAELHTIWMVVCYQPELSHRRAACDIWGNETKYVWVKQTVWIYLILSGIWSLLSGTKNLYSHIVTFVFRTVYCPKSSFTFNKVLLNHSVAIFMLNKQIDLCYTCITMYTIIIIVMDLSSGLCDC